MKKNVASQRIGAQIVTAADGSAFTGAVTVYVTLDAGTQAVGSVGAGACAHEGNGYHTYAPAQAETNGDLAAFTFIGTGAVPATVQVYTGFPQTGDSFADVAAIKAVTDNLERSAKTIVWVTVGVASSTTSVVTSSLAPAATVTDQFKGRILIFAEDTTTTALRGQATDITANTAGGVLTVTALTTAPASGDLGVIV